MKCNNCHQEATGSFCSNCGAPLEGASCSVCEAALVPGARFCTRCGAPVRSRPSIIPWLITGAALVALIVVLAWPAVRRAGGPRFDPQPQTSAQPPIASSPGSPPPLTGTPREQADRLFNRVMSERAEGNIEQAEFFLPMAIRAYRRAEPLDADGRFHLSLLEASAGEFAASRASAEQILATTPDHLLALGAAAEAAAGEGDSAAAREYYQRFVEAYDAENREPRPEYDDHARLLPEYRRAAERALRPDQERREEGDGRREMGGGHGGNEPGER